MRIPKLINDKNGKATIVYVNPDKASNSDRASRIRTGSNTSSISKPAFEKNSRSGRYSESQLQTHFPGVHSAELFSSSHSKEKPSLHFKLSPIKISNHLPEDNCCAKTVADFISDAYGITAIWKNTSDYQQVFPVISVEIDNDYTDGDLAIAYANSRILIAKINNPTSKFKLKLENQLSLSKIISQVGSKEVMKIVNGSDEDSLRVIPHIGDSDKRFSGKIFDAFVRNPSTPRSAINSIISNGFFVTDKTAAAAVEAYLYVKETFELDISQTLLVEKHLSDLRRDA